MVIIGILAGSVTVAVAGRGEQARVVRAKQDLVVYRNSINAYALEHYDKYPKTLNDLVSGEIKYVEMVKKDAWANEYVYKVPGKSGTPFDLYSRGKDGQSGTDDDISVWDEE